MLGDIMDNQRQMRWPLCALFSVASAIPLCLATAAIANEAAAVDEAAVIDEVVVTAPIRQSLERSLQKQRAADNIVNVIAADTIGRFPDLTAAGALARLPAVAVQRDQGQERYIQVRGAPANWTVVSFDGINVLGAEDRIFRFDSVPAALINAVELNKTLTPDMPGEALAGRVNIKTYSALDNPGFNALLDVGTGYVDLGKGGQEQLSGRLSWGGDSLGVVVAASHFQFDQQTDNAEPRFDATGVTSLRNAKYEITRETNSLFGRVEYQPNAENRVTLSSLYTEFLDHEERNQYTFSFVGAASGVRTNTTAQLVAVPVTAAWEKGEYKNSTWLTVLRGEHEAMGWKADWNLAYAETQSITDLPIINQSAANRALRPSVTYMRGTTGLGGVPVVSIFETVSGPGGVLSAGSPRTSLNQTAFDTETLTMYAFAIDTKAYTAKADFSRDWSMLNADATFKVGLQYDDRKAVDEGATAILRPNGTAASLSLRPLAAQLGVPYTPLALFTNEVFKEDFNRGYTANYIDNAALRDQLFAVLAAANAANAAGGTFAVPRPNPAAANEVGEKILSIYAMNTWRWDRHTLLGGLRVERTEIEANGLASVAGALQPLSVSKSTTMVFPSLHYGFDATESLKLRAAVVSGASRPSFADLRPNVTINDAVGLERITGGNPYLKPEKAWGLDASAEWYFAPASILSVSAFYRDVTDVIFDSESPVGDARFNLGGVNRSAYPFAAVSNGKSGKLQGVELTYYQPWTFLPEPFDGFGFQGSVALLDGDFTLANGRKLRFPGTSDRITNLSVFYEKFGASIRLNYQHRTSYLDTIGANAGTDIYWDAHQRLDLSARYQVNRFLTIYADANNLTDELGERYEGSRDRPYEIEGFGRRYMVGLRATF